MAEREEEEEEEEASLPSAEAHVEVEVLGDGPPMAIDVTTIRCAFLCGGVRGV